MTEGAGEEERLRLIALKEQMSPLAGETIVDRFTLPSNPLTAVTVMVELPVPPASAAGDVGLAFRLKSCRV